MESAEKLKPELPALAYSPNDIPRMTGGAVSRTRVFDDIKNGKLRAKKAGQRTLIMPEEAQRYINALPDRPTKPAA
jgi:hypothetical protein